MVGEEAVVGGSYASPARPSRSSSALPGGTAAAWAWADMADVPRLGVEALAAHRELLAAFDAGALTPAGLADGIERETLPRWSEAMRRIEKAETAGASGEAFDLLAAYVSARREASEMLSKAFRYGDSVLYEAAIAAWEEAGRVGKELQTVRDSFRAARRGEAEAGPAAGST